MTPVWSTACPDWRERIVAGQSLVPFAPLFPGEARAALDVLDSFRIVDAPGSPTFGQSSRPWVTDFAAAIFGAYDAESGRRLIREFGLLISKKNGKSTDAAAIMLTALVRNWRLSAEFYILAPTLEVANNSFFPARDMIKADDELSEIFHVREHEKIIIHRITRAFLKVVAADAETVSGKKAVGILIDELWLFGKRANAENMLREATGGLVSRPEGFSIYLSTQSDEPPAGVFLDKLRYWRAVRDGAVTDPRTLAVLYEFPEAMQKAKAYLLPQNFHVTNPNLGLSVSAEWIADELAKAQQSGDHALNVFLAKHLNVEIGQTLRADRWAGADVWRGAADPALTLGALIARSECIVIGIDGGGADDLLGLAVLGREAGTKRWLSWGRAYARLSVFRRRKAIAAQLIDFAKSDDLWVYDRDRLLDAAEIAALLEQPAPPPDPIPAAGEAAEIAADLEALVAVCASVQASGKLAIVGIDPAGVGLIVEALKVADIYEADPAKPAPSTPLIGVSQGYRLQGAIKTAERMLEDQTLLHADQPLLSWSVGHARTEMKANAMLVSKAASGTAKIDPLMALFVSIALMATNPEPKGSVYTGERGLISFG